MPEPPASPVLADTWLDLRRHTAARIALGRAGASLPTREVLAFELAHAQARDAVHAALDVDALVAELAADAWSCLRVASRAPGREAYLARPDWGRQLDDASAARLSQARAAPAPDLVCVIGDGLSAVAVQRHAAALLRSLRPLCAGLGFAPLVVATQARVALADAVGAALGAKLAVCLIGERPGLSAADSLGAYLTFAPRPGRVDAERNCISNIRPAGLAPEIAAVQIAALLHAALAAGRSGVSLRFDPNCTAVSAVIEVSGGTVLSSKEPDTPRSG